MLRLLLRLLLLILISISIIATTLVCSKSDNSLKFNGETVAVTYSQLFPCNSVNYCCDSRCWQTNTNDCGNQNFCGCWSGYYTTYITSQTTTHVAPTPAANETVGQPLLSMISPSSSGFHSRWNFTESPIGGWLDMTIDNTGTYLAAVMDGESIFKSSDSMLILLKLVP